MLARLRPKEAVRPLVGIYLKYGKDPSDKTAQEAAGVLSAYSFSEAGEELYAVYEESGYSPLVCSLISDCGFFDARSVLAVCKKDVHAGISLLDAGCASYNREELGRMKMTLVLGIILRSITTWRILASSPSGCLRRTSMQESTPSRSSAPSGK